MQGNIHNYCCHKTEVAAHKTQRQHKVVRNARRVEECKKVLANGIFDPGFQPAERQHGCMVSCKDQVLYWNTLTNDFGSELVALP